MSELELTGDHVAMLGDEDLRSLVVRLCEAELRRSGRPLSALLAGGNQTAPDGGVDVRVQLEAAEGAPTSDWGPLASSPAAAPKEPSAGTGFKSDTQTLQRDFIPRPETGFQVKCTDMPASAISEEMRQKGILRGCIKDLAARNGAYVIVSSKGTVADVYLAKRIQAMRTAVADQPGCESLKLDFYDRDRLARWVRQYPGVELWLRERVNVRLQGWRGYGCWAGADVAYLLDDVARLVERTGGGAAKALSVAEGLGRLRAALSRPGQVLRLVGLSGTGKTRLVQALFEKGIGDGEPLDQALVMYTDLGNEPDPSAREMLLRLGSKEQRAVVIVDNCNPKTHRTLAEVVGPYSKHLSLLTVEYDVADDDSPDATDVYELAPASAQVLEGILQRLVPELPGPDRHRIAEFSGGNARVALALARTVEKGETLGVLNDAELFRRLFRQGQAEDTELLMAAQVCSLVYSFDGEDTTSGTSELRVLAGLAEMTPNELYRHIGRLKRRDLVQARSKWRAVLPPALANRLAKWALEEIPVADITEAFSASDRLLVSFSRRLEYLHDSEDARAIAARWMEDEKWLADPGRLTELGRKLFISLAPLVPDKVLVAMERALGPDAATSFVLRHSHSLQQWGTLLRHLAYQPESFDRAAPLLLSLAEHTEDNKAGCHEAWKEMFRIGLSGTMAPPAQRVRLLDHLLTTATGKRREITWTAVEAMLEANHISSSHAFWFGARPQGYGWEPKSHDDVLSWFECAFALLRRVAASGSEGRQRARAALAAHFRDVWACGVDALLKAMTLEMASPSGWPAGWVAVTSTLRFDGEQMPPETHRALKELAAAIAPKGLAQEVRTFALGHAGGVLDVADALEEIDRTEGKSPITAWERLNDHVVELGAALAAEDAVLEEVLPELLADASGRQAWLGRGLGMHTANALRHWDMLREAFVKLTTESNASLLAGFVGGLRTKDPETANSILDSVVGDAKLDTYYPALLGTPRIDSDGDRQIASIGRAVSSPYWYTVQIAHSEGGGLSIAKFCDVVLALSRMESGLMAATDALGSELHRLQERKTEIPAELVRLAQTLLCSFSFESAARNAAWRLNQLAKIAFAGPSAADAAAQFAARFAAALDDYRSGGEDFGDLACTLFKLQPQISLDAFLGKPNPKRHLGFRARFVARHGPIVQCAPEEAILNWVSGDPRTRAPIVASEIEIFEKKPKEDAFGVEDSEGQVTLSSVAARLLELAPDKESVLQGFNKHLHPSHWSGSLAQTLAPYLALVERLMAYADPLVAAWAQGTLNAMRQRIERDRSMDIAREQSFE